MTEKVILSEKAEDNKAAASIILSRNRQTAISSEKNHNH